MDEHYAVKDVRCKNCRYWHRKGYSRFGDCSAGKIRCQSVDADGGTSDVVSSDCWHYWANHVCDDPVYLKCEVGEDYGCRFFELADDLDTRDQWKQNPPKGPLTTIVGGGDDRCPICGDRMMGQWTFNVQSEEWVAKYTGCRNPECKNYYDEYPETNTVPDVQP